MDQKLYNCDVCKLNEFSKPVMGFGEKNSILFIGEASGFVEDKYSKPFIGKSGQYLRAFLRRLEIDPEKCAFDDAVKCAPRTVKDGDIVPPSPDHISLCNINLKRSIAEFDPKVIVTLGTVAKDALGIEDSISAVRGKLRKIVVSGKEYLLLPSYHPTYVQKMEAVSGTVWAQFRNDIYLAGRVSRNNVGIRKDPNVFTIKNIEDFNECCDFLEKYEDEVCLDVESEGFNFADPTKRLLCIGLSWEEGKSVVIPWDHPQSPFLDPLVKLHMITRLKKIFNQLKLYGQNFVFDAGWLYYKVGVLLEKVCWDTMWGGQHLNYGIINNDLETLSAWYANVPIWKSMVDSSDLVNTDLDMMCEYCGYDAHSTRLVKISQASEMQELGIYDSFLYLFIRSFPTILQMRLKGIRVNKDKLEELQKNTAKIIADQMKPVYDDDWYKEWKVKYNAGNDLGLRSSKQVGTLIYDYLGFPIIGRGKNKVNKESGIEIEDSGDPSCGKEIVSELILSAREGNCVLKDGTKPTLKHIDFLIKLRDSRTLSYVSSQFIDNLDKHFHNTETWKCSKCGCIYDSRATLSFERVPDDYKCPGLESTIKVGRRNKKVRVDCNATKKDYVDIQVLPDLMKGVLPLAPKYYIYPNFNIAGTKTGRASCSSPAFHGLPPPELSPIKCIIDSRYADDGGFVICADASQMEYRVMACVTADGNMIEVYRSGEDLHYSMSSYAIGLPPKQIHSLVRRLFKQVSFATGFRANKSTIEDTISSLILQATNYHDPSIDKLVDFVRQNPRGVEALTEHVMDTFAQRFPNVIKYHKTQEVMVLKDKCCWTLTGRRRPLPLTHFSKSEAILRAINNPIQGTASDIITPTIAIETNEMCRSEKRKSLVFLTVHDSIEIDVFPSDAVRIFDFLANDNWQFGLENIHFPEFLRPDVERYLSKYPMDWLKVPIVLDTDAGATYGEPCSVEKKGDKTYKVEGPVSNFKRLMGRLAIADQKGHIKLEMEESKIREKEGKKLMSSVIRFS